MIRTGAKEAGKSMCISIGLRIKVAEFSCSFLIVFLHFKPIGLHQNVLCNESVDFLRVQTTTSEYLFF